MPDHCSPPHSDALHLALHRARAWLAGAVLAPVIAPLMAALMAIVLTLLAAAPAFAQGQGKRVALVVGNAAYADAPLKNPRNDAQDLADKLKSLGFDVTVQTDRNRSQLTAAIRDFGRSAAGADAALFYFAGHGVQVRGRNYLLPVGQRFGDEAEVESDAVDVNNVLARLEEAGAKVSLLILDACRNNPMQRGSRSSTRGLARMDAPSGALVAFAAQPGAEAQDGEGRNGVFTKHLLNHITTPGLPVEQVFKRVRADVERETGRRQSPREESSLTADFVFANPFGRTTPQDQARIEDEAWGQCRASGTAGPCQDYLVNWPQGRYAALARTRLHDLELAARPALPAPGPVTSPAPVVAANGATVAWRLASSFPKSLDKVYGSAELLSRLVAERTGGRFRIQVYPAGEIASSFAVVDAVQAGTVELGHTLPAYFVGKDPAWLLGSGSLFGPNARADDRWLTSEAGQAEWGSFASSQGLLTWPLGAIWGRAEVPGKAGQPNLVLDLAQAWWCRRPITGLDSLKGLRVRLSATDAAVWQRLGVVAVTVNGGDVYQALQSGSLDCTSWYSPYDDMRLGFHKVAAYLHHWAPDTARASTQTMLLANPRAVASLPPAYRAVLAAATTEAQTWMQQQYETQNLAAIKQVVAGGTRLQRFPPDVANAVQAAAQQQAQDYASRSTDFSRLYEAWRRAQAR